MSSGGQFVNSFDNTYGMWKIMTWNSIEINDKEHEQMK